MNIDRLNRRTTSFDAENWLALKERALRQPT
jgi:hypothetical protein